MSEECTQMVEGCRRRDEKSMRALYDATAPMAMGVCMRYAGNRATAQDLMQDGYVKVFEHLASLKEPMRVKAWVYQVMVNTCLNYRKKRGRTLFLEELDEEPQPPSPLPFDAEDIMEAMKVLTPQQRVVFNLMAVEEMEYGEAAAKLGCQEVTVRALYSRACQRLRERLTKSAT